MITLSNYKTIVFDAGGTLIGFYDPAPFQLFLQKYAAVHIVKSTRENAVKLMKRIDAEYKYIQRNHLQKKEEPDTTGHLWHTVFKNIWSNNSHIADAMFDWFLYGKLDTLFDDVLQMLEILFQQSFKLGVLSNFSPSLEYCLHELGIHHYFKFFIVSSVVGLKKPDTAIFDLCVNYASCLREEILYVGDNYEIDIKGAERAGITPVLIDRENMYSEVNCHRICKLTELTKDLV